MDSRRSLITTEVVANTGVQQDVIYSNRYTVRISGFRPYIASTCPASERSSRASASLVKPSIDILWLIFNSGNGTAFPASSKPSTVICFRKLHSVPTASRNELSVLLTLIGVGSRTCFGRGREGLNTATDILRSPPPELNVRPLPEPALWL